MIRRTKTLVVFNTYDSGAEFWIPDSTTDGYSSEQCADAYALARGYCADGVLGHYWKIGVDFGGVGLSQTTAPFRNWMCTKSFAPGQTPELNNTRYTGQTMITAVANMVADGGLDAIFTESLVPYAMPQCFGQAPDGFVISMCPYLKTNGGAGGGGRPFSLVNLYNDSTHSLANPELNNWITNNRTLQLPWGRIGWPQCTYADIVRVASDANWGETQDNKGKLHLIGGITYGPPAGGGDSVHEARANARIADLVAPAHLGAYDYDGFYAAGLIPGASFVINYYAFWDGTLTPPLNLFGLLNGTLPGYDPSFTYILSRDSWTPLRGAWAFNWSSDAQGQGMDGLRRGASVSIMPTTEPLSNGLPATDCVAHCLTLGLSMAEANFLSDLQENSYSSVYGAPDYAPYANLTPVSPDDFENATLLCDARMISFFNAGYAVATRAAGANEYRATSLFSKLRRLH